MTNFSKSIDGNPLLEGLPIEIDLGEWWTRLGHDPFKGEDIDTLSPTRKDLLLDAFTDVNVPTQLTSQIAYEIHRMLLSGLIRRNPRDSVAKQAVYQIAQCANHGLLNVPCFSTATRGILLKGITKQGKSRLIRGVLDQYPQVIRRGADAQSGWLGLDQLVYLVIPMPTDASKGGFLMQAFIELDKALGTSYAADTKIVNSSIDVQLVKFLARLALHRCGLLIVEEAQDTNELAKSKFGRDFNSFFLRVLNTGIPTIIVGNPKAFDGLKASSQLMSRLSDPGEYELCPSPCHRSPEWAKDLVPGLWGKNLLAEPDEPMENLLEYLWKQTGGFVHYLSVLRRETLRAAIAQGASRVTKAHVTSALNTRVMKEGKSITNSYWSGVQSGLVRYLDIPGEPDPTILPGRRKRKSGDGLNG